MLRLRNFLIKFFVINYHHWFLESVHSTNTLFSIALGKSWGSGVFYRGRVTYFSCDKLELFVPFIVIDNF
jgi:hypothetical protein